MPIIAACLPDTTERSMTDMRIHLLSAAVQTTMIPGFSNVTSTVRKIGGVTIKLKIEGHRVVVNKMSIYIDGKMEFRQ